MDDQLAVPTDNELQSLLDQFVCVRLVQNHGVDLRTFQFDGGLSLAIFFMNADGTIYGRYGSRSGLGELSDREMSLAGLKKSMRGAVDLHEEYRKDRERVGRQLSGKLAKSEPIWPTPEQIPGLKQNAHFARPFMGQVDGKRSCIHCHMIPANELKSLRETGKPISNRKFFPYPMPDAVGMHMDPSEMATIQSVQPQSVADVAGLRPGDRILRLQGQPILSTADIQWVLHNASDKDTLEARIERGTEQTTIKTARLELPEGWRTGLSDWRFINYGQLYQTLGLGIKEMPEPQAERLGLANKMALLVDRMTPEVRMQSGLSNLAPIVAVDGKREPMTVGALTAYVFREKQKGSKLKITTLQVTDRFPRRERVVEVTVK